MENPRNSANNERSVDSVKPLENKENLRIQALSTYFMLAFLATLNGCNYVYNNRRTNFTLDLQPDPQFLFNYFTRGTPDENTYSCLRPEIRSKFETLTTMRYLPLAIHIIDGPDDAPFTTTEVEQKIDFLNNLYKHLNITFFPKTVHYTSKLSVPKDLKFEDFDRGNILDYVIDNNIADSINIYFVNKLFPTTALQDARTIGGLVWDLESGLFKEKKAIFIFTRHDGNLAHEMGHFLGLLHPFETSLGQSLVSNENCSYTGDFLCSTPADPGISGIETDQGCEFTGKCSTVDPNGEKYAPDISNIMSYYENGEPKTVTQEQLDVMNCALQAKYSEMLSDEQAYLNYLNLRKQAQK